MPLGMFDSVPFNQIGWPSLSLVVKGTLCVCALREPESTPNWKGPGSPHYSVPIFQVRDSTFCLGYLLSPPLLLLLGNNNKIALHFLSLALSLSLSLSLSFEAACFEVDRASSVCVYLTISPSFSRFLRRVSFCIKFIF